MTDDDHAIHYHHITQRLDEQDEERRSLRNWLRGLVAAIAVSGVSGLITIGKYWQQLQHNTIAIERNTARVASHDKDLAAPRFTVDDYERLERGGEYRLSAMENTLREIKQDLKEIKAATSN